MNFPMQALLFATLFTYATSTAFSRFRYSWDTVPSQAFPGASARFMTATEAYNFTRDFKSLMIWGINATCLDSKDNVTTFPAVCAGSWCQCKPAGTPRDELEDQRFVTNMEDSLQAQGAALKAALAAQGLPAIPILGYVDHMSPQQYFAGQNALREDPALAVHLARLSSPPLNGAVIDCMASTASGRGSCCEQGSEFSIYNFGNPDTVAYYAEHVITPLIQGDGLDGTFLDGVDWALTFGCGKMPGNWTCTPGEKAGLVNGSLAALDAALGAAVALDKLLSVSAHVDLAVNAEYYFAQLELIARHGNAWRFYEGFGVDATHMATYLFEAQGLNVTDGAAVPTDTNYAMPVMMHFYEAPVYAPDWVQLAAFLIGANNNSYFSYSAGWAFDSFPTFPEFSRPLGPPLGPPTIHASPVGPPLPPWGAIPSLNMIFSLPPAPGGNASNAVFLGRVATPEACAALARVLPAATAFTHTVEASEWNETCYARVDAVPAHCFTAPEASPPCYSAADAGHTSGAAQALPSPNATVYEREFERLSVTLTEGPGGAWNATLGWH
jgi:hypothetical protein